ncbi:MAG: YerC/YecD family TrpR-related protein [Actinobacteria bacterium]|jgi:TrpR-related protein YerC/YecD|nr:YerC/YecD family TrpR-related protein [Actinomycetota bacterium]
MTQPTDPSDWRSPSVEQLADVLVSIDNRESMLAFLRDVCSHNELSTLAQRLEVARLVDQGVPYAEVARRLSASTATVTRVAQWLRHGEGGYRAVLDAERVDA